MSIIDTISNDMYQPSRVSLLHLFPREGRFEIQFDYTISGENGNCSYWDTYEEARAEVGRLWAEGCVTEIVDFVARAEDELSRDRAEKLEAALASSWEEIKKAAA